MRKPRSAYVQGRSNLLFKFKASRGDMEALVVNTDTINREIELQMPNGDTFFMDMKQSKVPVKRGDIVTMAYEQYTRSLTPVNPSIIRVRTDLSWKEVVNGTPSQIQLNEPSLRGFGVAFQPPSDEEKRKKLRGYLEEFARDHGMDPLVADSWYNVSTYHVDPRGAHLYRYKGSLVRCLVDNFPEVKFDEGKFVNIARNHWQEPRNRRKFFVDLAASKGFDPLNADRWYSLTFDDIIDSKGASTILRLYNWSISKALLNCFPEIGFDTSKFPVPRQVYQLSHGRQELETMAKKLDFNPNVRENWYSVSKHDLKSFSNIQTLLKHYGTLATMVGRFFPELRPFDSTKFLSSGYLGNDNSTSRTIFLKHAKKLGFDPLIPDNWYSLNTKFFQSYKDLQFILRKYQGSLVKCLTDLFPEIGLDPFHFSSLPQKFLSVPENQKRFFMKFAEEKGFDPLVLDNWRQVSSQDFNVTKNGLTILRYYGGDHIAALEALFPSLLQQH